MSGHFHVDLRGSGPVVVLEAGIAASSVSWELVTREMARTNTVLSYDRAGFGYSDEPKHGCTALDAANDLHGVLERSGLPAPYILVGHSFGGLIVRVFQQQHPELVGGLILVDPVARSEWHRDTGISPDRKRMLARGAMLSRRGAWLAKIGVVGFALRLLTSGSHRIPSFLAKASAGQGASVPRRLIDEVRKLPPELWPVVAKHWSQAKSFRTMACYLEHLPDSATQVDEVRTLGSLPVAVISAASSTPAAIQEHASEAALSTRGTHIVIEGVGHWVQLDAPRIVCDAIRSVLRSTHE